MFAVLNKYQKEEFYKTNPYLWIFTPEGKYKYEIFSCYITDAEGESYKKDFVDMKEYKTFLDKIMNKSIYKTGVTITDKDFVLSLSTCTKGAKNLRFIVHAKRKIQ